jgi:hypothetical protein
MEGPHTRERDPFEILRTGKAWCDQHTKVFLFMAWHLLDVEGHEVAIYHSDGVNGHTVAEVYYQDAWHLFDVQTDHQEVYRAPRTNKIMGLSALLQQPERVRATGHWWRGKNGAGKEGFYMAEGRDPIVYPLFHLDVSYWFDELDL